MRCYPSILSISNVKSSIWYPTILNFYKHGTIGHQYQVSTYQDEHISNLGTLNKVSISLISSPLVLHENDVDCIIQVVNQVNENNGKSQITLGCFTTAYPNHYFPCAFSIAFHRKALVGQWRCPIYVKSNARQQKENGTTISNRISRQL